jgi:uncharacterized membrane protein YphA (DoxX/SURF4 family)
MSTEPQTAGAARRLVVRALLTIVGIIGGLTCYNICQGMFAGYPQFHTDVLSIIGMVLIAATGGVAWVVDERRIRDDN